MLLLERTNSTEQILLEYSFSFNSNKILKVQVHDNKITKKCGFFLRKNEVHLKYTDKQNRI